MPGASLTPINHADIRPDEGTEHLHQVIKHGPVRKQRCHGRGLEQWKTPAPRLYFVNIGCFLEFPAHLPEQYPKQQGGRDSGEGFFLIPEAGKELWIV